MKGLTATPDGELPGHTDWSQQDRTGAAQGGMWKPCRGPCGCLGAKQGAELMHKVTDVKRQNHLA